MKLQAIVLALCTVLLVSACKQETSTCTDQQGNSMALQDALAAASAGECGQYAPQAEGASCNDYTGTWWLPINATQPGCSPACVVWVGNGTAEINWRCTGAVPPR